MGERREGEGGKADYINLWWDIFTPWSPAKGVPNASKFKFQEPEEGDPDELVYRMYAKRREDNADHYAQYSMDNVGITHVCCSEKKGQFFSLSFSLKIKSIKRGNDGPEGRQNYETRSEKGTLSDNPVVQLHAAHVVPQLA